MPRLLVCDLEGTLLGDRDSLRDLLQLLQAPRAPILAFASGRQGYSAMQALSRWSVTRGAYLIAGVGTELYRRIGKRWIPLGSWPQLERPWDAYRIRRELLPIEDLRPQPLRASSAYKLSYFASRESAETVRRTLRRAAIDATVIHSDGESLDVLPVGVDKGAAVRWLAKHLAIPLEETLTCGDTTSDLAMLGLPCASVVVGGCEDELRAAAPALPNTYVARECCAAGVIEGLRRFGWLGESGWAV